MSEILDALNEEQLKAVTCTEGPMLIVAGAGSGKTRVLTSRIAYLIEKGVEPDRILALTFTKKAAGEMKDRIALMVGERKARRLWMGTFHSVFIRFLREYAEAIGFPSSFTIYDTTDSVSCVKACLKQLGLDDKLYKPKEVHSRISKAKNDLVTPTPYANGVGGYLEDDRALELTGSLGDALDDFHIVDVESADSIAAIIGFRKHFFRGYKRHNTNLLYFFKNLYKKHIYKFSLILYPHSSA